MSSLKTIDEKGRLTLGRAYAGRLVEVDEEDDALVLKFRRVVPEREAWLWENGDALATVQRGLNQARAGRLGELVNLEAIFDFAEGIPDDE
jgi:hypothetical protein